MRAIRRELESAGTWTNPDAALAAFSKLVKSMHDPATHAAAIIAAAAATAGAKGTGRPRGKRAGAGGRGGRTGNGGRGRGNGSAAPTKGYSNTPSTTTCILPNDAWCKSKKTCHFNHDVTCPGAPCHRNSQVEVQLTKFM